MWSRFQKWVVDRWMSSSICEIVKKENGYVNIQIIHKKYGILVIHPTEEINESDSESGFFPYVGYINGKKFKMDEKRASEQNERMRIWFKKRTKINSELLIDHMNEIDRMLKIEFKVPEIDLCDNCRNKAISILADMVDTRKDIK